MSDKQLQFEEEEFQSQFNGQVFMRIMAQAKEHWLMVVGFLSAIILVSISDGYFTFISKQMIDEGIIAGDRARLFALAGQYGLLVIFSSAVTFVFIYLAGRLGEQVQMICERSCSITCRSSRSPISTARPWAGSCRASPRTPSAWESWSVGGCWI